MLHLGGTCHRQAGVRTAASGKLLFSWASTNPWGWGSCTVVSPPTHAHTHLQQDVDQRQAGGLGRQHGGLQGAHCSLAPGPDQGAHVGSMVAQQPHRLHVPAHTGRLVGRLAKTTQQFCASLPAIQSHGALARMIGAVDGLTENVSRLQGQNSRHDPPRQSDVSPHQNSDCSKRIRWIAHCVMQRSAVLPIQRGRAGGGALDQPLRRGGVEAREGEGWVKRRRGHVGGQASGHSGKRGHAVPPTRSLTAAMSRWPSRKARVPGGCQQSTRLMS